MSGLIETYIGGAFLVAAALIATGLVLALVGCVGMMIYALYKGATDATWR